MYRPWSALWVAFVLTQTAMAADAVKFAIKPAVIKAGEGAKITFALSAPTDVAVYVEDATGKIVRHLAAGMLGTNAPEPFKEGSLEQSLEWDGKDDDGRAAPGGPFKVRVGVGLKAAYAGECFAATNQVGPNKVENVLGLAPGPDGRLFVLDGCGGMVWGGATRVLVFRRDGSYEKTIKPFPSNTPIEKARPAGAFVNSFGGLNPFVHRVQGLALYPAEEVAHQPAVTPDGHVVMAARPGRLAVLDRDGGIPNATYAGPALGAGLSFGKNPFLAASANSTRVYIAGLAAKGQPAHAVYTAKLPDRGPAEVFFGEPGTSGTDNTHLNDARGIALDGKGHLLVADSGNNRVLLINETDKSLAGSFSVPAPNWLAVDTGTGAVYVQSENAIVKFAGAPAMKEVARLAMTPPPGKNQSWKLAMDATAQPPVLWAACGTQLLRCTEEAGRFSSLEPAACYAAQLYWRPAADPTRKDVLCKIGGAPGYGARLDILEEASGRIVKSFPRKAVAGQEGRNHRLGPDGCIYAQDHAGQAGGILRLNPDGTPKPFEATLEDPFLKGRLPVGNTGTTMWERDFSVDRKNDIYVRARGPEYHGLMTVHVYGQDGNLKRIVLQTVSDGMYGPRLDPQGNLYIMDAVKAPGVPFPPEFNESVAAFPSARDGVDWIYGSVMKFTPAGGAIWFSGRQATPLTYEGWGSGSSISGLRTTGGALTGTIARAPAGLSFPWIRVDAAAQKSVTIRLKNDSEGSQATLRFHRLKEGYIESCGPGFAKTIDIKPNSDFAEYTFDMSAEKDWREIVHNFTLIPTVAPSGTFCLDWVRFGAANSKLAWNFDAEDSRDTKLPATLAKEKVGAYNRKEGAELQGALWWRDGFSPLGDLGVHNGCHCTGSDFDVDDFGRVFAPDTGRFRVGVLDTAGNAILSFGGYGNQDSCGPDSYVMDPAGKFLRPRKSDDPKDLASPAARPDIAFAWIIGLAVTDKYAYISDVINKRVLRIKLDYAVEETCDVK